VTANYRKISTQKDPIEIFISIFLIFMILIMTKY